jgi:MarR family transcriptional regulator, 2-MHQ and catechol-resistance regulon repressor
VASREPPLNEIYQRLHKIYVLLDDGDRKALRAVGLSPAHYNLLRLLAGDAESEAGTVARQSVSQLARIMLCTRGNVTRLVQRLAEAGLVHTGPDKSDQRMVWVYLTPLGRDRLAAADAAFVETNRRRFSRLSAEQLRQLHELTGDLADQLVKHRDDTP